MGVTTKSKNPFNVLGFNGDIFKNLNEEQIKQLVQSQYRALSKIHHPDVSNKPNNSAKKFADISEAYSMLSDSNSKVFDILLKEFTKQSDKTSVNKKLEEVEDKEQKLRELLLKRMVSLAINNNALARDFKDLTVFDTGFSMILGQVPQSENLSFTMLKRRNNLSIMPLFGENKFIMRVETDGSITKRFLNKDKKFVDINYPSRRLFAILADDNLKEKYGGNRNYINFVFDIENEESKIIQSKMMSYSKNNNSGPNITSIDNSNIINENKLLEDINLLKFLISKEGVLFSVELDKKTNKKTFYLEGIVSGFMNMNLSAKDVYQDERIRYEVVPKNIKKLEDDIGIRDIVEKMSKKLGKQYTYVDYLKDNINKNNITSFCNVDLSSYDLSHFLFNKANLIATNLYKAKLTEVTAIYTVFRSSNLVQSDMRSSIFMKSDFSYANLSNANLNGSNFSSTDFAGTNLENVEAIGTEFTLADFSEANLVGMKLTGSTFKNAKFYKAKMNNLDLRGKDFSNCDFTEADLSGADFTGSQITGALFDNANLNNTKFIATQAQRASFKGAKIEDSDFSASDLMGSDFTDAIGESIFNGAKLSFSKLGGSVNTDNMFFIYVKNLQRKDE